MKRPILSQKARVVDILTESFDDNKSVNYVVKPDSRRKSRLRGLMDYCYDVCEAFGEVWISEDEQACGLILHPDKKRISFNSIWWDIKLAISVIGLFRVGQVMGRESKIKKFHPKAPFSYLWFIGVDPLSQNQGKGSRLLEEIIHHSEQQGRPIYLETSVDRNLPWYRKFGFEILQSIDLTYTLHMMRRIEGATNLTPGSELETQLRVRG